MFIYKITNATNDKVYIGQSIRPIKERFQRHISDSINNVLDTHFARAIRKYGPDNFSIELIDEAKTQEELNIKERLWIQHYDSVNNGYNETDAIYKCGGNTYKSKTDEEMRDIKLKLRQTKIGANNPHSKPIKCYNVKTEKEIKFDTVEDCRVYFKEKTHRFVTTRVLFQTKSLYKGEWKIAYADSQYPDFKNVVNKRGKSVTVINISTNEQSTYESIRFACKSVGLSRAIFMKNIKNNIKHFQIKNFDIILN